MSQNYRIEHHGSSLNNKLIKIYAKDNCDIPIKIDFEKRFGVLKAQGEQYLDLIHDFKVRKDDVWIITNPKCGTTWMSELIWLLVNDFDYENALQVDQESRCAYLEFCTLNPKADSVGSADIWKSPRVMKSHLPMHLLPKELWTIKPKIVYVTRDPKDACVSFYHHLSGAGVFEQSKQDFVECFLEDGLLYSPFWLHSAEFWKIRNEPFVYFTSYERMKRDLKTVVLEICKFLGKTISDEQMEKFLDHLSFKKMKENSAANMTEGMKKQKAYYGNKGKNFNFIRKGEVNSHKEELSEDTIQKFENWTKKCLEPYGVTADEILRS